MKMLANVVAAMLPLVAGAMSYPPYDIYPYLADSTDNPPLNYTKVCEPGRTDGARNRQKQLIASIQKRMRQNLIRFCQTMQLDID